LKKQILHSSCCKVDSGSDHLILHQIMLKPPLENILFRIYHFVKGKFETDSCDQVQPFGKVSGHFGPPLGHTISTRRRDVGKNFPKLSLFSVLSLALLSLIFGTAMGSGQSVRSPWSFYASPSLRRVRVALTKQK